MLTGTDPAIEDTVTAAEESPRRGAEALTRGATLGRYVILDRLGAGGMAVVYAAFDPQLDRRVALKIVAPSQASLEARERLQREAQAIARLNHPNVVTVHDVGTVEGGLFIAMELVDGGTLRDWIHEHKPSWEEALLKLRRVGAGLTAAHAAGIVHRDFKPDNVLLSTSDQIKVADFGIARWASPESAPSGHGIDTLISSDNSLTRTGAVMGTPGYMSPEQHDGAQGDERSDQFSFCVTAFEAFAGKRPYTGRTIVEIGEAKREGRIADLPVAVPGWIGRAIRRGLAPDPNERWPSMQALLDALSDDPRHRRRRWLGFGGVLVAGAALGTFATRTTEAPVAGCEDTAAELSGLWNQQRTALAESIRATGLPYAEDVLRLLEGELDAYAESWTEQRADVCEQQRSSSANDSVLLARTECLGHARDAVTALLDLLQEGNPERVADAPKMATLLPDLEACRPGPLLTLWEQLPDEPKARSRAVALLRRAEHVRLHADLTPDELERELESLRDEAIELELRAVELPTRRRLAVLTHERGDIEGSTRELETVLWEALAHGHDDTALDAAGELMWVEGVLLRRPREAQRWHDASEAMLARTGDAPLKRVDMHNEWGTVLWRQGRNDEAVEEFRTALAAAPETTSLEERLNLAGVEFNLASALLAQGNPEEGLLQMTRLEQRYVALVGPDHPALIDVHLNRAAMLRDVGRFEDALRLGKRAFVMSEATRNTQFQLASLLSVARAQSDLGDNEQSVRTFIRARDLAVQIFPLGHVKVSRLRIGVVEQQIELGHVEEAREAIAESPWGEDGEGHRLWALSLLAQRENDLEGALQHVDAALAVLTKTDPLNARSASQMRARLLVSLGRHPEAKTAFEALLERPKDFEPAELKALRADYDALLDLDALE